MDEFEKNLDKLKLQLQLEAPAFEEKILNEPRPKGLEHWCLYKLVSLGKDRNIIYDISVKELDQVFCVGYHSLSFESREFIPWMKENAEIIGIEDKYYKTKVVYVLPLSHKIKYLSAEMKAVIAYIQNQDDNNFVICTDRAIHSAKYEGFWFNLWMKFRKATGFYSKFVHDLFRVKALDVACELIKRRENEG
jgi:hypothetical protein